MTKIIYKKIVILALIIVATNNVFASIISNNDSSAFVTKAEFNALKDSFANQIDDYEKNMSNKIDGSISSYLASMERDRVSNVKFPLISNEKILIANSDKVAAKSDLKFGRAELKYVLTIGSLYSPSTNGGNSSGGFVYMTRDESKAKKNYEIFQINNKVSTTSPKAKFERYLYDGFLKLNLQLIDQKSNHCSSLQLPDAVALRWHADAWKAVTTINRTWNGVPQNASANIEYDDRVNRGYHFFLYGHNLNWGTSHWNATGADKSSVTLEASLSSNNEIKYYIDDGTGTSNVWVKDPTVNKDNIVSGKQYAPYMPNSTSDSNYKLFFDKPSDADITSVATIYNRSGDKVSSIPYRWTFAKKANVPVQWDTTGTFASDGTTVTAGKWYEYQFESVSYKGCEIENVNVGSSIKNEYSTTSYPYHGYLTEGFPIGTFAKGDSIEFTIDTTKLGAKCNFAISTKPFDTAEITNTTNSSKYLSLSVNGVKAADCVKELSIGKNKIVIDITGKAKSDGKTNVFFKMAYKRSDTTNNYKRGIITWPETYKYTVALLTKDE